LNVVVVSLLVPVALVVSDSLEVLNVVVVSLSVTVDCDVLNTVTVDLLVPVLLEESLEV